MHEDLIGDCDFYGISEARWHRGNEPVLDRMRYFVMDGFFCMFMDLVEPVFVSDAYLRNWKNSRYAFDTQMNLWTHVFGGHKSI